MGLTLHNHPQKANYADDGSDWPTTSHQGHWSAKGANLAGDTVDQMGFNPNKTILDPAHVHIDLTFPLYAELNAPVTVKFLITLRQFAGQFGLYGATPYHSANPGLEQATNWFWNDTQSALAPAMIGGDPKKIDSMGVQTYAGHFTIAPRPNFHGWDSFAVAGHSAFTNGDQADLSAVVAYWNNVDPNAPITQGSQGPADKPFMGSIYSPIAKGSTDAFGDNEMFVENFLPIAPLAGPWVLPPLSDESATINPLTVKDGHGTPFTQGPVAFTNSYGGSTLLNTLGSYQTRRDANFHMQIPGTTVDEVDQAGIIPAGIHIDNTNLTGTHKYALIRFQPENSIPTNGVATLLVVTVPVGTTTPPPPPTMVTVPNLIGLTQMAAGQALTSAGLMVGTVSTAVDAMATVGNVDAQMPASGTMVNSGSSVNITVVIAATPPPPPTLPVLIGPVNCYKNADGTYMFCAKDPNLPSGKHVCMDNVPVVDEQLP